MTRDDARAHWAASGLTYEVLTKDNLQRLRAILGKYLRYSGLINGSFRVGRGYALDAGTYADIRCEAYYFKGRQAITFEPQGFIGFAGWADDVNVQPILAAFVEWVDELMKGQRHAAA